MLFPFRTSSIFRNRWIAVLYAAGICWTAVQFAGGDESKDTGDNAASTAEVAQMTAVLNTLEHQK